MSVKEITTPIDSGDPKPSSVPRGKLADLARGLMESRIFRATVVSFSTAALFAALSNPAGWMIAAAAAASFVAALGFQALMDHGFQKITFELTAIKRLKQDYQEVFQTDQGAKIFLGAFPNRLNNDAVRLQNNEVQAVLTVNEDWERKPIGLSLPYTQDDWAQLGINYKEVNAKDHSLLQVGQLQEAADYIHEQLQADKNVYVHCRAGHGRSAMAVAAYLIRYQHKTADEAAELIKAKRDSSTINKKLADRVSKDGTTEEGLDTSSQKLRKINI